MGPQSEDLFKRDVFFHPKKLDFRQELEQTFLLVNCVVRARDAGCIKSKIKSSLYSLNTFSGVTSEGAHLRGFAPRPIQSRLQRWRVVGNASTRKFFWGKICARFGQN